RRVGVRGQRARRCLQLGEALGYAGVTAEVELEVAACRAQGLVDACQHLAQALCPVGREQAQPVGLAAGAECCERALDRLAPQDGGLVVGELVEAWVEPHRERVGTQQPRAEAVDGRDPRTVELPPEVVASAVAKRRANARAELARRLS